MTALILTELICSVTVKMIPKHLWQNNYHAQTWLSSYSKIIYGSHANVYTTHTICVEVYINLKPVKI